MRVSDPDRLDAMELVVDQFYILLTMTAKQRRLTDTEVYLLEKAARVSNERAENIPA